MWRRNLLFACALLVPVAVAVPQAGAATFTNTTPITIPSGAPAETQGAANPYPSSIAVSGIPGSVADVNLTLTGLTHTCGSDVDILLVGPTGQKSIVLSDAAVYVPCAESPLPPVNVTIDDEAGATYPCNQQVSGTFKPTENAFTGPPEDLCLENDDPFVAPAPAAPYPAALSSFDAGPANGAWNLFVFDHASGDVGTIGGGWSLDLTAGSCAGKAASSGAQVGTGGSDNLVGTPGPDVLIGNGGNDTIKGLGGNDVICGGPGKDKLFGGPGKDQLRGEAGKDQLKGQGGKDTCLGGKGDDAAKACEKEKSI
jgi:subtilisin-like proprotein convertase family protein